MIWMSIFILMSIWILTFISLLIRTDNYCYPQILFAASSRTFFWSCRFSKKRMRPPPTRKQLLGLPTHIKTTFILIDIDYCTILVLSKPLYSAFYCPEVALLLMIAYRLPTHRLDCLCGYAPLRPSSPAWPPPQMAEGHGTGPGPWHGHRLSIGHQ